MRRSNSLVLLVTLVIVVVAFVCYYIIFYNWLEYGKSLKLEYTTWPQKEVKENNITCDGDQFVQKISRYRQRFLLWYYARSDVIVAIGEDRGQNASKFLIYRCDTGTQEFCGGWADRIKGMVFTYLAANLTGRNFKIDMVTPGCDLNQFLMPNEVNWSLPVSFHPNLNTLGNDVKILNKIDDKKFYKAVSRVSLTDLIGSEQYVYIKTNFDNTDGFKKAKIYENELSWAKNLHPNQILAIVYQRLFVLHPRIQSRLQNFLFQTLPTPQHKLICVHIRMGRNPTIPHDSEVRNSPENLSKVWNFILNHSKTDFHKVFIMADSADTITEAYKQSFRSRLVSTSGPIIHIERSKGVGTREMCEAQEKIVLDQHILMNCDVLMVSNSGLSQMASYIRASDDKLYCFLRDGDIIPCNSKTMSTLY